MHFKLILVTSQHFQNQPFLTLSHVPFYVNVVGGCGSVGVGGCRGQTPLLALALARDGALQELVNFTQCHIRILRE